MVQSCPEASPAKWHLAHTTWFFETFVLREFLAGYQPFHPDFLWLFNSYYNDVSDQPEKKLRASFSRPALDADPRLPPACRRRHRARSTSAACPPKRHERIELGIHHEQQHQELLCYDIKHAFWTNPLHPAYRGRRQLPVVRASPLRWLSFAGGLTEIGSRRRTASPTTTRSPRHTVLSSALRARHRAPSPAPSISPSWKTAATRAPTLALRGLGHRATRSNGMRRSTGASSRWRRWMVYTMRGLLPLERDRRDARLPCELLRGRRLRPLGRQTAAHGSRVGGRRRRRRSGRPANANLLESGQLHPVAALEP